MTVRSTIRRIRLHPAVWLLAGLLCAPALSSAQVPLQVSANAAQQRQPLGLTNENLPDGIVGMPFRTSVGATGGSGVYSILVTGDLPAGVRLYRGPATIAVSGTPTTEGTYSFRVAVTDLQGGTIARDYSFTVQPQTFRPAFQQSSTVTITDAEAFHFTDVASVFFPAKIGVAEGFHFTDAESVFMPAVVKDAETFHLTDTPSVFFPDRQATAEAFHFGDSVVVMTSAMAGASETFHFGDVVAVTTKVGISPSTIPAGAYNTAYSATFVPVGFTGTASIAESGALPAGVTFKHILNQSTVVISGTPTVTGSFPFTLTVTDTGSGGTSTINYLLVINPASQTINVGSLPTPTYGGAAFSLTGVVTATSGLTPTITFNSGPVSGSGTGPYTISGAGTASFTATQTGNTVYAAATPVPFSVVVSPAVLNVTGSSATRGFDQPNPAFGFSFGSFVNGDTSSVVSGSPVVSTTATPVSPISGGARYLITPTQGTLAATNYSFNFISGTLTITKASQLITFYPLPNVLHGTTFPLSARSSSGLPVTYTVTGPATITNNILSVTGAGAVQITASQAGNGNYNAATSVVRSFTAQ